MISFTSGSPIRIILDSFYVTWIWCFLFAVCPKRYSKIYSINRAGRLVILGPWEWALIKFSPFSASVMSSFGNKTINNNKTRRCNKVRFLWNTLKKTSSSSKSLIVRIQCFLSGRWKGDPLGVGAYLSLSLSAREVGWGWALIRGWALINFFFL